MKRRGITRPTHPSLDRPSVVRLYHDDLLFTAAYPPSHELFDHTQSELRRVAQHVHHSSETAPSRFRNSGIAGAEVRAGFSLYLNAWLLQRFGPAVAMVDGGVDEAVVTRMLSHRLDPLERELLHDGRYEWATWTAAVAGQPPNTHRLYSWILAAAARMPGTTAEQEDAFARFELQSSWRTRPEDPSITTGRAPRRSVFVHHAPLLKHVDLRQRFTEPPPRRIRISMEERTELVELSRAVLAQLDRETDPSTYANIAEVSYHDLGRGMTIALYPMQPSMKMVLQSYIGFMAFKNGIPIAYGGGWLLGSESGFGVNVFPPFRGGESAVIVADLLRLYHHEFGSTSFTVDPYQIGYGNEDGIASGAFWFYYRLGFRPIERRLASLARTEAASIAGDRTYRTSASTLETLAESTMRWTVPGFVHQPRINVDALSDVVARWTLQHHDGDRDAAAQAALARISGIVGKPLSRRNPIADIAVLLVASGATDAVPATSLRAWVRVYSLKRRNEGEYVRASQRLPEMFECLARASTRR